MRERVEDGDFAFMKIHTDHNGSNILTKTLPKEKLVACRMRAGLVDSPMDTRVKGEFVVFSLLIGEEVHMIFGLD